MECGDCNKISRRFFCIRIWGILVYLLSDLSGSSLARSLTLSFCLPSLWQKFCDSELMTWQIRKNLHTWVTIWKWADQGKCPTYICCLKLLRFTAIIVIDIGICTLEWRHKIYLRNINQSILIGYYYFLKYVQSHRLWYPGGKMLTYFLPWEFQN